MENDWSDDEFCDNKARSYHAQRMREIQRWKATLDNPDLLLKKYLPNKELVRANQKSDWYVGALNESPIL
jgi:hypothetical protein